MDIFNDVCALEELTQHGLYAAPTSGDGNLCGFHALIISLNSAQLLKNPNTTPQDIQRLLFTSDAGFTPEYEAFLRQHLPPIVPRKWDGVNETWIPENRTQYEIELDRHRSRSNLHIEQLNTIVDFLTFQNYLWTTSQLKIGWVTQRLQPTEQVVADAAVRGPDVVTEDTQTIWLWNDNQGDEDRGTVGHWEGFRYFRPGDVGYEERKAKVKAWGLRVE